MAKSVLILGLLAAGLAGGLRADDWSDQVKAAVQSQRKGDLKAAEKKLLKALMLAERFGEADPRAAYTLDYLGTLYQRRGMDDEALRVYGQALKGFDKALGPGSEEATASAGRLAEAYEAAEQWPKAEALRRRLLDQRRAEAKPDPLALAQAAGDLAYCLDAQKSWDDAMKLYGEALALREQALGPEASEVAETLSNQGRIHLLRGELGKSEERLRRALAIDEKALGPGHRVVADDLRRLAAVLEKAGKAAEAAELQARAQAVEDAAAKAKGGPAPTPKPVPRPEAKP